MQKREDDDADGDVFLPECNVWYHRTRYFARAITLTYFPQRLSDRDDYKNNKQWPFDVTYAVWEDWMYALLFKAQIQGK